VAARLDGGRLRDCRLVLGGVAPIPWRCRSAEAVLEGAEPRSEGIEKAAQAALAEAEPLPESAYRMALTRQAVVDALSEMLR
jgi:xanthine dehydrogenase YagS FAD-binding subunit